MSPSGIRGAAGILFGILGLLLLRSGPGFAVSAAAAPGCKDGPSCYSECEERGSLGPQGQRIDSLTARCVGDCNSGIDGQCSESSIQNPDGSRTFQCVCNPNLSPASCSGFASIKPDGQVKTYICAGDCGAAHCRPATYNIETTDTCPVAYSLRRRCVCE